MGNEHVTIGTYGDVPLCDTHIAAVINELFVNVILPTPPTIPLLIELLKYGNALLLNANWTVWLV